MKYYAVDAFTDKVFRGNPAGVCLLDRWLADVELQHIAAENNLSETAFLVDGGGYYELRWFSPSIEVALCGHATLASAHILFSEQLVSGNNIMFKTKSGEMRAERRGEGLYLDFPAFDAAPTTVYPALEKSLSYTVTDVFKGMDFLVLLDDEEKVRSASPDFHFLKKLKSEAGLDTDDFGIIITARGKKCDFVSRFFAPNMGVDEDPVTGRAHCMLTPYWAKVLGKKRMTARQLSRRGGELCCEYRGERVSIGGKAVTYMAGEISL